MPSQPSHSPEMWNVSAHRRAQTPENSIFWCVLSSKIQGEARATVWSDGPESSRAVAGRLADGTRYDTSSCVRRLDGFGKRHGFGCRSKEEMANMKRVMMFLIAAVAIGGNGCDNSSVASNTKVPPEATAKPTPSQPSPSNAAVARPSEPGDILSVLTVEHQVDLSSQRDGVVISVG